jgi:hypothetical protein
MVFIDEIDQVSGYFHIVKKEKFTESITLTEVNPTRLSMESLG